MITVVKLNSQGEAMLRYQGEVIEHLPNGVVIEAFWSQPTRDLGYTQFAPGDRFIEYYYSDRWFNIFAISSADGARKGWYCNVAEPAQIDTERIEQVDLLLDVWVNPQGDPLILDEDEFVADITLSGEQRVAACQALRTLLHMVATHQAPFA